MAVTVTSTRVDNGLPEDHWGKAKIMLRTLTLTGTYATGGFALAPSAFGLKKIHTAIFHERSPGTDAYLYHYDIVTGKVRLFVGSAAGTPLAEEGNTDSVGTRVVQVMAIGWA